MAELPDGHGLESGLLLLPPEFGDILNDQRIADVVPLQLHLAVAQDTVAGGDLPPASIRLCAFYIQQDVGRRHSQNIADIAQPPIKFPGRTVARANHISGVHQQHSLINDLGQPLTVPRLEGPLPIRHRGDHLRRQRRFLFIDQYGNEPPLEKNGLHGLDHSSIFGDRHGLSSDRGHPQPKGTLHGRLVQPIHGHSQQRLGVGRGHRLGLGLPHHDGRLPRAGAAINEHIGLGGVGQGLECLIILLQVRDLIVGEIGILLAQNTGNLIHRGASPFSRIERATCSMERFFRRLSSRIST